MLQLRDIEYAISIVKYGSIHKAADALFVSQPAITKCIKRLEDEIGVALFTRQNNRLQLTDAGKLLIERGLRIIELSNALETDLKNLSHTERSTVTIGLTPYYSRFFFPKLYNKLHETNPEFTLNLKTGKGLDLFEMLKNGEIDLWFTASGKAVENILTVNLSKEEIVLIYKKSTFATSSIFEAINKYYTNGSLSIREIEDLPLIMYDKSHGLRTVLEDVFEKNHIEPNIILEAPSAELISDCVLNGIGVGFVPIKLVAALIETGSDIGFIDFGINCPLSLKYNGSKRLTPAKRTVIETAKALFRDSDKINPLEK